MTKSVAAVRLDTLLAQREWVRRLAHALVRDPAAADDLAQDAWVAALRSPPSDPAAVRGWFRRVLVHLAVNRARGEGRREQRELAARPAAETPSPDSSVARLEEHRLLVLAVLDLPSPARETVVLRYFEDLPAAEIARIMDVPASTVRSRLARALTTLRERLDSDHGGDGRNWRLALAPLLIPTPGPHARTGSTTAAASTGALLMIKSIAVVLLTAAGLLAWSVWPGTVPGEPPGADEASSVQVGSGEGPARLPSSRRLRRETPGPEPSLAAPVGDERSRPTAEAPPTPTDFELEVTVLNADGSPAAGAEVDFRVNPAPDLFQEEEERIVEEEPAGPGVPVEQEIEDHMEVDQDRFARTGPDGKLLVRRIDPWARVWARLDDRIGESDTLEMSADRRNRLTVRLGPATVIRGTVREPNGDPVPGAFVRMTVPGALGPQPLANSRSAMDGTYALPGMPGAALAKGLTLLVSSNGFVPEERTLDAPGQWRIDADITLERDLVVTGRFIDEEGVAVAGVTVEHGDGVSRLRSDAGGRFSIRGLRRSGGSLTARPPEHAPATIEVPADAGGTVDLGDIVLRPGARITGVVLGADGRPVQGATVYLVVDKDPERHTTTDEHGTFVLDGVGDGTYRVVAAIPGPDGDWRAGRFLQREDVRGGDQLNLVVTEGRSALLEFVDGETGRSLRPALCHVDFAPHADPRKTSRQSFPAAKMKKVRVTFPSDGAYRVTVKVLGYEDVLHEAVEVLPGSEIRLRVELRRAAE